MEKINTSPCDLQPEPQPAKATEANNEPSNSNKKRTQAQTLLEICEGIDLFHTSELEGFATIRVGNHLETWSLASTGFRTWLRREYYLKTKSAPASQAMQNVLGTLQGKAQFDGKRQAVFLRVGNFRGNIYIDLTNDSWQAVEVSSVGWRIINNPPIKFRRTKGMLPLPYPEHCACAAAIDVFKNFLNLDSDNDFKLVMAWVVSALHPDGPYFVLVLYGEQGAGKSSEVKVLRSLTDPNATPLRREPRNSDDLMVSTKGNWVVAIDNMSFLSDSLSDDLCRLATGGGLSKRQHYSDDEEVILSAKRPIILNGIDEFIARGDLASRSIIRHLPTIGKNKRRREEKIWQDFEMKRAQIFGAILTAMATGIAAKDTFKLNEMPRMADAWHWVTACEPAFGWERGDSLNAFAENQIRANEIVLSSSSLYRHIKTYADEGWSGNAELLLNRLRMDEDTSHAAQKLLPQSPRTLSDKLRRLAPALRSAGIEVTMEKTSGSNSIRLISFRKLMDFSDAIDASTQPILNGDEYVASDDSTQQFSTGRIPEDSVDLPPRSTTL